VLRQLFLSFALAAGSAAIAIAFGLPLAIGLTRIRIAARSLAALVVALLLLAPLYVHLAGWDAFGGALGWFGRSAPHSPLSGLFSSIWVHGLAAVPWSTVLIAVGLAQIPRREEELALLDAPALRMFMRIILPRLAPWIALGGAMAAITSWQDMTVTNVYLVPTVTEGIYNRLAIAGDAFNSTVYPLPALVVFAGLLGMGVVLAQRLLTADFPATGLQPRNWPVPGAKPIWTALVWLLVSFLAGVPLAVLIWRAGLKLGFDGERLTQDWSLPTFTAALGHTASTMDLDFLWTGVAALGTALLTTILAIVLAWWARTGGWKFAVLLVGITVLLATPGPLVGVVVIRLLNNPAIPGFTWLYDRTVAAPVLAQTARALPVALLIAWQAIARFDCRQQEAAALDGYGPWQVLWRIILPQRWRAIVAMAGVAAAISVGDVTCSLLVLPAGMDTVARRLFGMIHSGVDDQVAAACLLVMAITLVPACLLLAIAPFRDHCAPSRMPHLMRVFPASITSRRCCSGSEWLWGAPCWGSECEFMRRWGQRPCWPWKTQRL
jgi:iron(III) transport system permease protein